MVAAPAPTGPPGGPPPDASAGPDLKGRAAFVVALGIFLSLLMGALDQFVVLTALPNIVSDLGEPNGFTFVVSAYLVSSTVAVPIFARLSDILSRRNVFLVGMGIFIAGSALAGFSANLPELIAFRGVQGFGSGCFFPVGISIIGVAFSPERRARLTGAFSGVFGIATVAGPFLGSYIVANASWRWVFYINLPIGALGMIVLASGLGVLRPLTRERFDVPGALLVSAWVGALTFALYQVANAGWGWTDPRIVSLLLASVVGFVAFVICELYVEAPLIPLGMFRDRVIASACSVAALSRAAVFSLLTVVSFYVGIVIYHGGPGAAPAVRDLLYFLVLPMVVGSLIGGQGLTRIPYRPLVAAGTALSAFGLYLLTFVTPSTPTWTVVFGFIPIGGLALPFVPIGLGLGLTFGPTTVAVQYRVDRKAIGQATGLIQFWGTLGASVALSLFSSFEVWRYGTLKPSAPPASCFGTGATSPGCAGLLAHYQQAVLSATVTAYVDIFAIMTTLAALAFVASLFLSGRMPKSRTPASPPAGAA